MKFQVVAVFLVICLLSLEGARATPWDSGSFDGNKVGSGSMNDNGNSYGNGDYGGNGGSFDGNTAGDNSFNNNGNTNNGPMVWY